MPVGSWMISFKENVWHKSFYLDIKDVFTFLKSFEWFSLRTSLSFTRTFILKFPKKINFSFLKKSTSFKSFGNTSKKKFTFGGL